MNTSDFQSPIGFRPSEIKALVNREIVEQHAEEAAFLWIQRDNAVVAPNYSLKDLAELDERVEANIDGLRLAGEIGWKICKDALDLQEPGEVFTAGVLAFESKDKQRIDKVLDAACFDLELTRALISALGWMSFEQIKDFLKDFMVSERSQICRMSIAAFAAHRIDPGPALFQAISDQDAQLRARALKAAGQIGRADLLNTILPMTSDPDESCRFFAAWSAARLGDRSNSVLSVLRQLAEASGSYSERALNMALRCMALQQAKDWYRQLKGNPGHQRLAAIGAGIIGDPDLVEDLIAIMDIDELARVAGESFSMITGVDLEGGDLDRDARKGFDSGPSEEPEDEDVEMDPDEDLLWPAPEPVSKWWQEHRKDFRPNVRYLGGKEINAASFKDSLKRGHQHRRAAVALEMAIREPLKPLFETRAPGKRQLKA
jgi:uncharacterized protein (TIGR02270 family)